MPVGLPKLDLTLVSAPCHHMTLHTTAMLSQGSVLYRRVEWEGPDVWFAHCCMLDNNEMQQFADNGIGVSHCPSSNLRLASGETFTSAMSRGHCCLSCLTLCITCVLRS